MTAPFASQSDLFDRHLLIDAVEKLSVSGSLVERGAVFTKREVVEFILDLTGYTADAPLPSYRFLEPAFGGGDFLLPAIDRLLIAASREGSLSYDALAPAIRAIELHRPTFEKTSALVFKRLEKGGLSRVDAERLCDSWLHQGDFLLTEFQPTFTHVVGNPPYVRQEAIPDVLMAEYRSRYKTIYDRADIYVPFIQRSLQLLEQGGKLGFICADRWMKNKYGKKLRELVSRHYALTTYVDMCDVDAFHTEVSAYPAITIIERAQTERTRVFARPSIETKFLKSLAADLTATKLPKTSKAHEIQNVTAGSDPWVFDSFEELALVRRLELQFPALEDAGCKVGIGVATGADNAFIGDFESLDVEASRKLPLVMTRDLVDGHVAWRGKAVINPFDDNGKLVNLELYPKLRTYLEKHREQIAARHIAQRKPSSWFRTIDRIYPSLVNREKLLIPDIQGDASIVYENGNLYPHHNLYFITSDDWNIHALQTVMRSGIARLFVSLYCTRMRGGYLRFQAQYLRKIRVPEWKGVSVGLRQSLADCAVTNEHEVRNELVAELYGLTPEEAKLVEGKTKE